MRVIRNFPELRPLDANLTKYILEVCPWLAPDWNPHETGIVYILQDNSRNDNWILTQPHLDVGGNM